MGRYLIVYEYDFSLNFYKSQLMPQNFSCNLTSLRTSNAFDFLSMIMHHSQPNSWVEAAHGTFRGALQPPVLRVAVLAYVFYKITMRLLVPLQVASLVGTSSKNTCDC